jgi:hypothetical protein
VVTFSFSVSISGFDSNPQL